jgi:hypothetical protein
MYNAEYTTIHFVCVGSILPLMTASAMVLSVCNGADECLCLVSHFFEDDAYVHGLMSIDVQCC